MGQMDNLDQIAPKLCNFYLMIHTKEISEMLSVIMGVQLVDKCYIEIFQEIF